MNQRLTKKDCICLLREQYAILQRYPRRSDFSSEEVVAIKAYFGPWPRALEAAGVKPARDQDRLLRNREKRMRAKRNRVLMKKKNPIADMHTAHENGIVDANGHSREKEGI